MILIGVLFIALGGIASGSYYLPLKSVKGWSWESGWIIQGLVSWIIGPWLIAMLTIPDLFAIISATPSSAIWWPILFGFGWGIGGLTWGLSIRYLGLGLGNALPLGITSALATLVPIIRNGQFMEKMNIPDGQMVYAGIIVSLIGIGIVGWAATIKDKEQSSEDGQGFDLKKGLVVCLIAGVMSAFLSFGQELGQPMTDLTMKSNEGSIWIYNPIFAIMLIGGFAFNFLYVVFLNIKNGTHKDYSNTGIKLGRNYLFAALAGVLWYSQMVFKNVGETMLPADMKSVSWALLFTFVVLASNVLGLVTGEWKGVSGKAKGILVVGLLFLVLSIVMVSVIAPGLA